MTPLDRKSTRLNSSHLGISYAVFCLKKTIVGNSALGGSGSCAGRRGCGLYILSLAELMLVGAHFLGRSIRRCDNNFCFFFIGAGPPDIFSFPINAVLSF